MKKALHFISKQALLWCLFFLGQVAIGQMNTGPLPFSKSDNFDAYNPSTAVNATSTLPSGWAIITPTSPAYNGRSTGSTANSNGFWSYGTTPDFSLGAICGGKVYGYSVNFKNTSGSTITSITLSWDYEQWRYVNAAGWDVTGTGQLASNTVLNSKDFTGSATGTNGTVAVTSVSSFTLTGLSIANGQSFGLKWEAVDDSGSDSGVSIDNFSITASAAPAAVPVVTGGTVNGTVGTALTNYQISATNSPTSYAIATGTLPAGLSLDTSSGVISGTPTTAGNSSVTVTAGNTSGTSPAATLNFVIAKGNQTITFATLANKQYGDGPFTLVGTASSGLTVTYTSSNTDVATISGNTVTILGVGTTDITASQSGNTNYNTANSVIRMLTVTKRNLTISGLTGDNKVYNASNTATVSGTPVLNNVLAADIANVTLAGTPTFTFANATIGVGKSITASGYSLAGSAAGNYSLTQLTGLTATISAKTITVTGAVAQNKVYNANTIATVSGGTLVGVEAADNANVSTSTTGVFASANAGTGIGVTVTLTGSAATNYSLTQPGITADITKANQMITFNTLPALNTGSAPINLNTFASTTSGLALTYMSSNSNVVSISGNTLTIVGLGTAIITASQEGNTNYNVAINTTQSVTVSLVPMIFYSHNFNDSPDESPYVTSPLTTIPAGILNSNITSSQWVSSTSNFTNFVGSSGTALVIQPSNGAVSSMTLNLSIATGYKLDLTDYSFWARRTNSGPTVSSITVNSIAISNSISISTSGAVVSTPALLNTVENLTGNVSIVINLTSPSSSSQNLRLDDFKLTGYITPLVTATTWITTTPATTPAWTNGTPTALLDAIIAEDYNETNNITAKNLTINTGKVLTIKSENILTVAGDLTNEGSIIFKSDAAGTGSFAAYTGAVIAGSGTSTVERYIPSKRAYRILTAPLKGTAGNTISQNWQGTAGEGLLLFSPATYLSQTMVGYTTGGGAPNIKKYDGGWQFITNLTSEPMYGADDTDTKPFLVFVTGASDATANIASGSSETTLRPTGKLITGTVTNSNLAVGTFHALSNPYASPINPVSLVSNNAGQKLWLLDPSTGTFGGYATFDGTDWAPTEPQGSDAFIQSGQGFFVRSASATSFEIKESDKVSGSSSNWFAKNENTTTTTSNVDKIRVLLYKQIGGDWKLADGVLAINSIDGSNEVDEMDTNKISNFNESLMFRNNTTNLSIERSALPLASTIQPLKLTGTTVTPYQLRIHTENYTNSLLLPILEDTLNGTFTSIPSDGSDVIIPFTGIVSNATTPDNRFRIIYGTDLSNNTVSKLAVSVYPNPVVNGQLNINLNSTLTTANYTITNLLGQSIQQGQLANSQNIVNLTDSAKGFYILSIVQDGKSFTTKIYVQ